MDFELKTDLGALPAEIDFNYEAIKVELDEKLERYRNLVVTENDIPQAKKDRASLNNLAKALDEERRRVKNDYLIPYNRFEERMNALTAMIKEPSEAIDRKVKEFENGKKKEKRAAIERFYFGNIGELRSLLPLEAIYNNRWENVTFSLINATQEIMAAIEKTKNDLASISSVGGKHELAMKDVYLRTRDLSAALREQSRLQELDENTRRLEEERKVQVEKTASAQTQHPAAEPQRQPQAATETQTVDSPTQVENTSQNPPDSAAVPAESIRIIDFRIWASPEQLTALRMFLIENNIKYGRVPNISTERVG